MAKRHTVEIKHGNKTMILKWFNARGAVEVGTSLADQFALQTVSGSAMRGKQSSLEEQAKAVQALIQRADGEVYNLKLNFYTKAKLANSFKWRLLEKGVMRATADEVTQMLLLHISEKPARLAGGDNPDPARMDRTSSNKVKYLLSRGNRSIAQGAYAEAVPFYEELLTLNPRLAEALNNLGAALFKLGRYKEAENLFRQAIAIRPAYAEAHGNLGVVLRWTGRIPEAEDWLRRALKLKPNYTDARYNLGFTLILRGRLRDANAHFKKVLRVAPRHAEALFGMGQVAGIEGRFDEAGAMYKRALEINPKMPIAWAAVAGLRKMTSSDHAWLQGAEEIAASEITSMEEANLRFAMGKYYDDVEDFERAFHSYRRANELQKKVAENYGRDVRSRWVDDLIRVYTRQRCSQVELGASASAKPVFVVGMMRSGTSLVEQIIASHPSAHGAGELGYWSDAVYQHEAAIRQGALAPPLKEKLSEGYLRALEGHSADALRIVDKTPVNSDYLGVIHEVFPNARIIYMRRDPIDTCLSCYFQQFLPALNFSMDLSDLAHYYREHRRLMAHWHAVLPPGTILDVPYAELVDDANAWTRKILDFLALEWDERCLDFKNTRRPVMTASFWQVRQGIYKDRVERWRNYRRFIRPLLDLRDLDS
jgi:tetratricopeptide (TPR) repeat protein